VWLGLIWNVDPEHGPRGGNQNAMAFHIDTNDGAVETLLLGEAWLSRQVEEDETQEDSEKSCTHVWHDEHSFLWGRSGDHYRIEAKRKQIRNCRVELAF